MNALQVAERSAVYALQETVAPMAGDAFELMATASQGVAKLRELILSLAVQGKLTSQSHGESQDSGWKVVPLKQAFASIRSGGTPSKQNPEYWGGDIAWASVKDLGFGNPVLATQDSITDLGLANGSFLAKKGSVLICTRMGLGKIGKAEIDVAINQDLKAVELVADLDTDYFINFFKTLSLKGSGMTVAGIKQSELLAIPMPLPPLAEQRRIVARVEELMGLCDELEAHGRLQDEQHARLVATLFDALVASASPAELADNWQRVASHFDLLLDRPAAVDALEQTILQLAVRGLLVPQDPRDEPAARILEAVRGARAASAESGARKRHSAPHGELCFTLPAGWEAVGLLDLCTVGGGATPSKNNSDYWGGDVPWVSPKDMKVDAIGDAQDRVTEQALRETRLPLVPKRSLLVVVRGMILAHSFPVAVTTREVTLNQDMKSLAPDVDGLSAFLALVLKGFTPEILGLVGHSTHGTCKLESERLFGFAFGLPPLAEQRRIVARVEELRALCANLRRHLQQAQATQANLADALVARAIS